MTVKYTNTGLWIEQKDDLVRIGLSEKGQDDVGEVMYVELPKFDEHLSTGDNLISVEGAKAVSEMASPISGTIHRVHKELEDHTELLNSTDRNENWIVELTDALGINSAEFSEDPWFGQPKSDETE